MTKNCIICEEKINRKTGRLPNVTCSARCAKVYRRATNHLYDKIKIKVKNDMMDYEEEELKKFKEEIKRLIRNAGRSSLISVDELKEILKNN